MTFFLAFVGNVRFDASMSPALSGAFASAWSFMSGETEMVGETTSNKRASSVAEWCEKRLEESKAYKSS